MSGPGTQHLAPRVCQDCGKEFIPVHPDDLGCSPRCRMFIAMKQKEQHKKDLQTAEKERMDSLSRPPRFDLKAHPYARAEWMMSIPVEYRDKFRKFLSPQEIEKMRELEKKRLSEERMYTGIYVKKDKVVDMRKSESDSLPEDNNSPTIYSADDCDDD